MSSSTEVKVYEAGPPREGEYVVQWRTPIMPCSSFLYFDTREAALIEAAALQDPGQQGEPEAGTSI